MRVEQQSLGHAAEHVSTRRVEASAAEDDEVGADGVRDVCDLSRRFPLDQMLDDFGSEVAAQRCRSGQRRGARLALRFGLPGQRLGTYGPDRRSDRQIRNDADRVQLAAGSDGETRRSHDDVVSGRGVMSRNENRRLHVPILPDPPVMPALPCRPTADGRSDGSGMATHINTVLELFGPQRFMIQLDDWPIWYVGGPSHVALSRVARVDRERAALRWRRPPLRAQR